MSDSSRSQGDIPLVLSSFRRYSPKHWESLFFLVAYFLLVLQVYFFYTETQSLAGGSTAIAWFSAFESFVIKRLFYVTVLAIPPPLLYLLLRDHHPAWGRKFFDVIGTFLVLRMTIQFIGLNILVFDSVTPRFLLITQLLFFLPYSLLLWGWIYWRLDAMALSRHRTMFRVECDGEHPRPIDYIVASFSSVFSASISGISGKSARARILVLIHGFLIYDIMGLTLSRAISLVQSR